jgi:hypothetical protein
MSPERVSHLPQLGQVLHRRVVEGEQAAVAELQDGDPGEGFRDRGPVEDRVGGDGHAQVAVGEAVDGLVGQAPPANEREAAAHHVIPLEGRAVESVHLSPGRVGMPALNHGRLPALHGRGFLPAGSEQEDEAPCAHQKLHG